LGDAVTFRATEKVAVVVEGEQQKKELHWDGKRLFACTEDPIPGSINWEWRPLFQQDEVKFVWNP